MLRRYWIIFCLSLQMLTGAAYAGNHEQTVYSVEISLPSARATETAPHFRSNTAIQTHRLSPVISTTDLPPLQWRYHHAQIRFQQVVITKLKSIAHRHLNGSSVSSARYLDSSRYADTSDEPPPA